MATKRSVGDLKEADLKEKKVLVRVDLDVPLDDNFNITDDTKIREALLTIMYLIGHGAKVILSSHLGCPKGVTPKYSLKPLVPRLSELLGVEVKMANDCIGAEVEKMVAEIPGGGVLLLENVRFYKEEEKNDPEFANKLASLADLYVNDAIGTAAHASTEGVAKYFKPSVAGFLVEKKMAEASAAAPGVFHVKPLIEDQNLEETRVQAQEDLYLQTKRKRRVESSQLKISFSDKDLKGEPPHKGPLVITLKVGNCLVDKIIVNTGSSCNIMYLDAFKKFGFTDDLRPPPLNNREARSNGQVVQPKGMVTLPVHAGSKTVDSQFLVIDAPSTYNVILGRSWIHEMKAVVSTYHRLLKFLNKDSTAIEDIRGEAFDSTKTVFWNGPMGM